MRGRRKEGKERGAPSRYLAIPGRKEHHTEINRKRSGVAITLAETRKRDGKGRKRLFRGSRNCCLQRRKRGRGGETPRLAMQRTMRDHLSMERPRPREKKKKARSLERVPGGKKIGHPLPLSRKERRYSAAPGSVRPKGKDGARKNALYIRFRKRRYDLSSSPLREKRRRCRGAAKGERKMRNQKKRKRRL